MLRAIRYCFPFLALAAASVAVAQTPAAPTGTLVGNVQLGIVASPFADEDAYPARAIRQEKEGRVRLRCDVNAEARLQNCKVLSENPRGWDFGTAAQNAAREYKVNLVQGGVAAPIPPGAYLEMNVEFRLR